MLARTFFHHLIEGLEYLHSNGIAHLDLKLEKLMLGTDYRLKIFGFETCQHIKEFGNIKSSGTVDYRAPELMDMSCENPFPADIYSAGVILFILKFHFFPYVEDLDVDGYYLHELLVNGDEQFWSAQNKIRGSDVGYDENFKDLFMSMVTYEPSERATIEMIRKSAWYQGPIYYRHELKKIMSNIVG